MRYTFPLLVLSACLLAPTLNAGQPDTERWFIESINMPSNVAPLKKNKTILIAVVDDGMRLTHQDLAEFIWTNPNEKANNGIDDDGNGYIDDTHGWDVSDQDNDAAIPGFRSDLYHGTHLASVIVEMAKTAYGESASNHIQLLPVKSVADEAATTYIKDGYEGIRYAIRAGADIIVCSWGSSHITPKEIAILKEAADKGILIVSASGNLPQELDQYPAAYDSVLAVGSVERDGTKTHNSIYGQFVDIAAPGTDIYGASIDSDTSYDIRSGTSFSTAMVATAAAMTQLRHPNLSATEVEACLISSARTVALSKREYSAKLGAGLLDVDAAVACELFDDKLAQNADLVHSKGFLRVPRKGKRTSSWRIQVPGEISGLRFKSIAGRTQLTNGKLEFRAGPSTDSELVASYTLDALPESVFVPGKRAFVTLYMNDRRKNFDWLMRYEAEAIDFKNLYCRGERELSQEGSIGDGSGPDHYSAKTDCKWLINAPQGKLVRFRFDRLDTESRTDIVHFFNGNKTNDDIMAMISGNEIPPVFTSWGNQVLIWFASNDGTQGQGWNLEYTFVDP